MKATSVAFAGALLACQPSDAPVSKASYVLGTLHKPATLPSGTCRASWHPYTLGDRWTRPYGTVMVCASRTLPKGTRVRVSRWGRSVVVVVADWGPARWTGRDLDLSREAFAVLGAPSVGEIAVDWRVLR